MGTWSEAFWANTLEQAPRRDRRSGPYRRFCPDPLCESPLVLSRDADHTVARAERAVRDLNSASRDLAGIARFLLRSEAIASSRIEGISPSARQVALAELGQQEAVQGISASAQLVANNMTIVREATSRLQEMPRLDVAALEALHRSLLPDEPRHHGLRTVQNWIGGSDWHPLEADYVPPSAEDVRALMEDLVTYLDGAAHSPVVQAALVHAQFETVHPFTDGNGRVGRALVHTVLARRGLTTDAVLPISLVLSTLRDRYVGGLTSYRSDAPVASAPWHRAREAWITTFAEATTLACEQAGRIATELEAVRADWSARYEHHRISHGARRALRSDSATTKILADLPATPILTVSTVMRIHGVSRPPATRALEELVEAGILGTRTIGPGRRAYVAEDVLEMITWAERRLASTRFDTRVSAPSRPVPAAPQTGA